MEKGYESIINQANNGITELNPEQPGQSTRLKDILNASEAQSSSRASHHASHHASYQTPQYTAGLRDLSEFDRQLAKASLKTPQSPRTTESKHFYEMTDYTRQDFSRLDLDSRTSDRPVNIPVNVVHTSTSEKIAYNLARVAGLRNPILQALESRHAEELEIDLEHTVINNYKEGISTIMHATDDYLKSENRELTKLRNKIRDYRNQRATAFAATDLIDDEYQQTLARIQAYEHDMRQIKDDPSKNFMLPKLSDQRQELEDRKHQLELQMTEAVNSVAVNDRGLVALEAIEKSMMQDIQAVTTQVSDARFLYNLIEVHESTNNSISTLEQLRQAVGGTTVDYAGIISNLSEVIEGKKQRIAGQSLTYDSIAQQVADESSKQAEQFKGKDTFAQAKERLARIKKSWDERDGMH
ncbi:hypothetical protein JW868_00260 [Candidatus Woesearchaeota archaeon]|nr:hypothetical protein [Candidatus Woesearchaeota archaeon]